MATATPCIAWASRAAALLLPLCLFATTGSDRGIAIALFCALTFCASLSLACAPAALQIVTPGPMRAQISAAWMLCLNVITAIVGPTAVGLIADQVFGDRMAVGLSLALVNSVTVPLAALAVWLGRRPFAEAVPHAARASLRGGRCATQLADEDHGADIGRGVDVGFHGSEISEEAEKSIHKAEKAQHKGEKIDKSKLEKPESLGSIVADYVPNVNKTYRADELFVVSGLLGTERLKEYAVITDKQKKVEFVQTTINAATEQYKKNRV